MSEERVIDYLNEDKNSDFLVLEVFIKAAEDRWPDQIDAQFVYNDSSDNSDPWYIFYVLTEGRGFYTDGLGDDASLNKHTLDKVGERAYRAQRGNNSIHLEFSEAGDKSKLSLNHDDYRLAKGRAPYRDCAPL